MPELEIPFRQWLPDQQDLNNPGLVEAKNVYLSEKGYQPLPEHSSPDITADSLSWNPTFGLYGYASFRTATGGSGFVKNGYLYALGPNIFNLSNEGSILSTHSIPGAGISNTFDFARFGDSVFVAGNSRSNAITRQKLFKFDILNQSFSDITSVTAGLSIARVGNFLMMCGTADSSIWSPYSIRWSGYNQPESWGVSELTQSGFAELERPSMGAAVAVSGGDYALVFQTSGITRIDYVGPPKVWRQMVISDKIGAVFHGAVINVEGVHYLLNKEGAFSTDGTSLQRISSGIVDKWIKDRVKLSNIYASYHKDKNCIVWGLTDPTRATPVNDQTRFYDSLVLNVETQIFSLLEGDYYGSARGETEPLLDDFDLTPVSVVPQTSVTDAKLARLDGDALEATLTTGHISNAGGRAFVDQVEPQYIGSGATVALSAKERLRDDASFSSYVAEEATTGIADIRADGRAIAVSVKFPAASDWSDFTGVVADASEAGKR